MSDIQCFVTLSFWRNWNWYLKITMSAMVVLFRESPFYQLCIVEPGPHATHCPPYLVLVWAVDSYPYLLTYLVNSEVELSIEGYPGIPRLFHTAFPVIQWQFIHRSLSLGSIGNDDMIGHAPNKIAVPSSPTPQCPFLWNIPQVHIYSNENNLPWPVINAFMTAFHGSTSWPNA